MQSYLPGIKTPRGLVKLRAEDLENLRGGNTKDRTGERKAYERIYDYDVYNDLGDPDEEWQWKRPVLGGNEEYPYPRRCRTGRPQCISDSSSEQRSKERFYVPRDEEFSEVKQHYFPPSEPGNKDLLGKDPFTDLPQIESLFREGIQTPPAPPKILQFNVSSIISSPHQSALHSPQVVPSSLLQFPPPESYRSEYISIFILIYFCYMISY